ncbi:hypothetical protein JHK86_048331 [Glycine max]|nr:hypothetical protein JHK86_048331 [Glycine max]
MLDSAVARTDRSRGEAQNGGLQDWNNNNNPSILVVRISRKTWVVKEETKGCCRILGIFYLARFRLMLLASLKAMVARSKGFKMMIEAVGDYNQQLNPPTQEMNKPHDDQIKQTQHGETIEDEQVVEPSLT